MSLRIFHQITFFKKRNEQRFHSTSETCQYTLFILTIMYLFSSTTYLSQLPAPSNLMASLQSDSKKWRCFPHFVTLQDNPKIEIRFWRSPGRPKGPKVNTVAHTFPSKSIASVIWSCDCDDTSSFKNPLFSSFVSNGFFC